MHWKLLAFLTSALADPSSPSRFVLPTKMIAGYTGGANATLISKAVNDGVNVLFWSFMEFHNNTLSGDINSKVVGPVHEALMSMGRGDVLHFISFGGWNAPHLLAGTCGSKECCARKYAKAFKAFDDEVKASVPGFVGFAGIDWDLEGMDDLSKPSNEFNLATYELMIGTSRAVQEHGYLVSMVPAQSYFDCTKSGFSPSLRHPAVQAPQGWTYHGLNTYTVLYARCPECFDLVMVQYYEGYALDGFYLYWDGSTKNVGAAGWPRNGTAKQEKRIIKENIECLINGWEVNFDGFLGLQNNTMVTVPAEKLVIGLANGWAGTTGDPPFKCPFFSGATSGEAWCESSEQVRGFFYWTIGYDSGKPYQRSLVRDLHAAIAACPHSATSHELLIV